jgi:hypothetical protein
MLQLLNERKDFLKLLDDTLFEGDLTAPLDSNLSTQITKTVVKRLGKKEGTQVADNLLEF